MRRRAVALSFGVLALAGCGSGGSGGTTELDPGQAAVSTAFRVSQDDVNSEIGLVLTGLGQPPGEPPAGLASATTARMVLNLLVTGYADGKGIEATQTEVEQGLAELAAQNGGEEALNNLALQSGIPTEALDQTVRTNLLVSEIGRQLNAAGDSAAQVESARVALTEYSAAIEVEVAPRYGTWNDATLSISPGSAVAAPEDAPAAQ